MVMWRRNSKARRFSWSSLLGVLLCLATVSGGLVTFAGGAALVSSSTALPDVTALPAAHRVSVDERSRGAHLSTSGPPSRGRRGHRGGGSATLTVSIITNNRETSLRRLCDSLLAADYSALGDFFVRVDIVFNLEASSTTGTIAFARGFEWPHGFKHVRKRARQGGLILAVSESWYPSSTEDFGCLLEDDIEVSPHYFRFVSEMMLALQREPDPRVVGISLYSPRRTETTNPPEPFNSTALMIEVMGAEHKESPYLLQTPCSWGAVYFPNHWEQFVDYLRLRFDLKPGVKSPHDVLIPSSRTNGWKGSWKKFHFELLYLRGQYLVYPNYEGQRSLSTNHMEKGEHIKSGDVDHKRQDFTVPLLVDGAPLLHLRSLKVSQLRVLNLFGKPWLREEELKQMLAGMASGASSVVPGVRQRQPSLLAVGEELSSVKDEIMMSAASGRLRHYGVVQNDGQFVIYRDDAASPNSAAPIWSTQTFVGEVNGTTYGLTLSPTGSLELSRRFRNDVKSDKLVWSSPHDRTRRHPRGSYVAQLKSDGCLAVYWKSPKNGKCLSLVWETATKRSRYVSMLSVGATLSSASGDGMASINDRGDGKVYHGAVQSDGQFVVMSDHPNPIWSTNGYKGEVRNGALGALAALAALVRNVVYHFSLSKTGSLRLEQVDKTTGWVLSLVWSSPPDRVSRPAGTGTYHARLESDGNLAVYWADRRRSRRRRHHQGTCLSLVWQSIPNKVHTKGCIRKNCDLSLSREHFACTSFPAAVPALLQDASTFTLLISTHSRFELLSEQLSYYSASPMISTIVVTWHNMNIKAPPDARVNGTYIRFESPTTDSLNNRFQPLAYITTEAVFILDDDIKLHLQDMHNMFAAWKENKQNLVGASPRWVDGGSSEPGSGGRASAPHNLAYLTQSEASPDKYEGYSLMLTRTMMMHRDYLHLYTCGGSSTELGLQVASHFDQLRSLILSIVAAEFNCEDIGMNFVVNAARSSANPPGADAAPLFVRPLHRIGDFGKMGDTGLHQKKSHTTARTDCLNQMNRAFWQATGQSLPVQTRVIDAMPSSLNSTSTALMQRRYSGLSVRLHDDCMTIERGVDGVHKQGGCSWDLPAQTKYNAYYVPSVH